jgi:hypothetical protein
VKAIGSIYLSWRMGKGFPRRIVGVIKRNTTDGVRFKYIKKGVAEAEKDGFIPYIEFPDIDKEYSENGL